MTDFLPDDARPDPRDTPADADTSASRLDRRSFLRALSGSALTLVAGGLTVTLTACQGAGAGGGSPTTVNVPFSGVGAQTTSSPSSSSINRFGSSSQSGVSSSSSSSSSSASSGSSGSSGSGSSGSSSSSSSVTGALRRAAGKVNGWSTRV